MVNKFEQQAEFVIDEIDMLRVLTDVRRQNILELLILHPLTVKEISRRLHIPVSKLYYHVNMLEEKGMIRVAETNVVSGIIEKTYLAAAKSYKLSQDLLSLQSPELQEQIEGIVISLMDRVRGAFLESANAGLVHMKSGPRPKTMVFESRLALDSERGARFATELEELVRRYTIEDTVKMADTSDLEIFNFFVMSFPSVESLSDVQAWQNRESDEDPS